MNRHRRPEVSLHINELVLTGFDGIDVAGVGEALQQELARLIAERGYPHADVDGQTGQDVLAFDVQGDVALGDLAPEADAQTIAHHVAQALYGRMTA